MTAHDERDVETVAEAICGGSTGCSPRWHHDTARAVLDVLDLPGLIRAAKAEALTEAADDMERIFCAGNLLGRPTDDWLRLRAAEIDPEEGDDGRM